MACPVLYQHKPMIGIPRIENKMVMIFPMQNLISKCLRNCLQMDIIADYLPVDSLNSDLCTV